MEESTVAESQIHIWTKYEENAEAHRTGHTDETLANGYSEEYLAKFIYFFADKDGNPPFEPRSNADPDSEWMLEHKGEYLKTVGAIWYCEDDVCGCYNAEVYDVFQNKVLPNARVHKGVWEGEFTTDHDSRATEDSIVRYRQELKKTDPEFEARIEWQNGVDWDRELEVSEEIQSEISELANWLYDQDWGRVGGPLHIITDDNNLEDSHLWMCMRSIDEDPKYPSIHPKTEVEKAKCRRLIQLLVPLNVSQRDTALRAAEQAPGPY